MDKKTKKILLSLIGLLVLVGVIVAIHFALTKPEVKKQDIKYNKSSEILKDSEIKGLSIHDISLKIVDGNKSYYSAKATNNTDKKIDFTGVAITFFKDDIQIGRIEIYSQRTIEPGETIDLENITDIDLYKATSSSIEWISE